MLLVEKDVLLAPLGQADVLRKNLEFARDAFGCDLRIGHC